LVGRDRAGEAVQPGEFDRHRCAEVLLALLLLHPIDRHVTQSVR
jgi:hypothetical protein